jgi:hypothetical protein
MKFARIPRFGPLQRPGTTAEHQCLINSIYKGQNIGRRSARSSIYSRFVILNTKLSISTAKH